MRHPFTIPALIVLAALVGGVRVGQSASSQPVAQIPLTQILAEAETQLAARQSADVAALLDRVLARVERGEKVPEGLSLDRLKLAAATAHFRAGNVERSSQLAEGLAGKPNEKGATAFVLEARWLWALSLAGLEKYAEAVPLFAGLAASPAFREKAWLYQGMAAQQAGSSDVAVEAYHRHLAQAPRNEEWADAALAVIALHLERGEADEAQRGLRLLAGSLDRVDNVAGLNLLSLRLGDVALAADDPAGALAAYRTVRSLSEVKTLQAERDRRLQAAISRSKALARMRPDEVDAVRRLEYRLGQTRAALHEVEKLPRHDAAVLARLGNAFQQRGNIWEAALVYERLLQRFEKVPERERVYAGLVAVYAESGRQEKTMEAARRFLAEFPESAFTAQALFVAAAKAQERGDTRTQLEFLELALARAPHPELRESLQLMQANALFAAGRHEEARASATTYLTAFADGRFVEDALYLQAMAGLLLGPATRALDEIRAYLARFPEGRFVADARYRLMAAEYSIRHYDEALASGAAWLDAFPEDHAQRGEVLSLQGDVLAAKSDPAGAIASYKAALGHSLADEGLGYAMDELTRLQMARQEFDEAAERWEELAEKRPEHPFAINAAYWIGRIRSRQGQPERAMEKMAAIARRHLADPTRDTVERLLLELAKVMVSGSRALGSKGAIAGVVPSQKETWTKTIQTLLLVGELKASATAQARACFLEAEIASLLRQPERCDALFQRLTEAFSPAALPPGLLGRVGDRAMQVGHLGKAHELYSELVTRAPRSLFADFGHVGLGELALSRNEPEEALAHFTAAIDKAGAQSKLREATLGQARCLLALERWDSARALFERIAANRAWRGEATVQSVFALGEILARRGDREGLAQAQAHYQRIYVGYRKFLPWVAKAYLRSGETLERLGQHAEALATYREMLRDVRLAGLPEVQLAETHATRLQAREV